ncbi:MAG: tryptophan synthase alpha chain [Saprospiraceae bacterium]|nr:MAG: tryptophan synthase alpha chain [Saprospiraceae bacterium]
MNRLTHLFSKKQEDLLNIYFTAGYPNLEDTGTLVLALEKAGVDLIEVGIPYSDPLADGPTIQESGQIALKNGMNLALLLKQISIVRQNTEIPLILMGYFNQVMQYGVERFVQDSVKAGVDGVILPDLPLYEYEQFYRSIFEEAGLQISFLMTPQTSPERIRKIDQLTSGFIYMVSSSAITGGKKDISEQQLAYFDRISNMQLSHPRLIGFGISNHETFATACKYANGAIIGSAFIRALAGSENIEQTCLQFVKMIKEEEQCLNFKENKSGLI